MHIQTDEQSLIDEGVKALAQQDIGEEKCEQISTILGIIKGTNCNVSPLA